MPFPDGTIRARLLLVASMPVLWAIISSLGNFEARAQAQETCLIGFKPPPFVGPIDGDRLHPTDDVVAAAHTAGHGQFMFGGDALYFTHLAVFMDAPRFHPHNFQVILEAAFVDPEDERTYRDDRLDASGALYTAFPEFDQGALIASDAGQEPLRLLSDTPVFRGHFEHGGEPLSLPAGGNVNVAQVLYSREFLSGGDKLAEQNYLLFGRGDDVFLAHLISAPPDFQQVVPAAIKAPDIEADAARGVVESVIDDPLLFVRLPDRSNEVGSRLRSGDTISCALETGTRAGPVTIELQIGEEAYCEAGELSRPNTGPSDNTGCPD